MTQKHTDDLLGNMVYAAALSIVECAMKRANGSALYVSLSGNGDCVIFPISPGATAPLEPKERLVIRRSNDGCTLRLRGKYACTLKLHKTVEVGPLAIRLSNERQEAEAFNRARGQRVTS